MNRNDLSATRQAVRDLAAHTLSEPMKSVVDAVVSLATSLLDEVQTLQEDVARHRNSHTVLVNENKRLTAECERLRKMCPVPYPQFCFQVEKCRGRAYCPRRPSCCE